MQAEPVRLEVHKVNTAIGEMNDQGKWEPEASFS